MAPRPRAQTDRATLSAHTKAVAAVLNGERNASGLSWDELAERAGVPKRTLQRYISPNSTRDIPLSVLSSLAVALNIDYSEIFRRAELRLQPEPEPAPKLKSVKKSAD